MKDEQVTVHVTEWMRWDDGKIKVEFVTTREDHIKVLAMLDSLYQDSQLTLSKPTGTKPTS